jgi:hypothetical protein
MKHLFVALLALFAMLSTPAQVSQGDPNKVQAILDQLAEIDLSNQILPLLLSKDQIRKLLPVIERCRANIRNQEKKEADRLREIKVDSEKVFADVLKGKLPPQAFLDKATAMFKKFESERAGVFVANGLIIVDAMNSTLNDGQKKAAIGVVDKVYDEQAKKWEDSSDAHKLRYFGMVIFLNDRAYSLLTKMAK